MSTIKRVDVLSYNNGDPATSPESLIDYELHGITAAQEQTILTNSSEISTLKEDDEALQQMASISRAYSFVLSSNTLSEIKDFPQGASITTADEVIDEEIDYDAIIEKITRGEENE